MPRDVVIGVHVRARVAMWWKLLAFVAAQLGIRAFQRLTLRLLARGMWLRVGHGAWGRPSERMMRDALDNF